MSDGKRYERGLGGYPKVSIADAREIAFDNRRKAKLGRNPFVAKAKKINRSEVPRWLGSGNRHQAPSWRHPKSEKQWRNSLADCAKPLLKAPVDAIEAKDVLSVVETM